MSIHIWTYICVCIYYIRMYALNVLPESVPNSITTPLANCQVARRAVDRTLLYSIRITLGHPATQENGQHE